ncbi:LOW QUALITY PROTEIN: uncharacterized protein [Amphiura filiformis]|uniref:LOW QUALITY PROTEIN: uncharacterized protein n=1 Tax=Amphiura filiformis TaxID=82378 RepID=UPI003B21DC1D
MSIETLLEAAKFVEWSTAQLQHSARDDEVHQVQTGKNKASVVQATPVTPPKTTHHITPTTSPPPQPIAVSPKTTSTKPITSPLPQEAPWKPTGNTSPRETSNRPLIHQVIPPHRTPPRALTPPASSASYLGVQYRPLAPLPSSQSPDGSTQSYVSYSSRFDSADSNSNESNKSKDIDDKKTDTREVHNKLEKNRRAHLKDCFDNLKAQVPNMEDKKIKTSNLSILQGALRYLQALKRKERELEHQLDKLARQKITYQQRMAKLKMEKRLTEDQLPWNRKEESEEEVEEEKAVADDDDQASTSTASEAEEEERKSRAQSPELSFQPQPGQALPVQPQLGQPPAKKRKRRTKHTTVQSQSKQHQSIVQGQSKQHQFIVQGQSKQQQSMVQGQSKQQQSLVQGQLQQPPRNPTPGLSPKMMHSVTKEVHSGPYVISRHIITHMAQQQTAPTASRPPRTETLPIISQLARKQAGKPIIGRLKNAMPIGKSLYPGHFGLTNVTTKQSSSQSEATLPIVMQQLNSPSGHRQTVSQLLGKQTPGVRAPVRLPIPSNHTPGVRAPVRLPIPSNHTPVIQAPIRFPVTQGAAYPLVTVPAAPSTATMVTLASKHVTAGARPAVTSGLVHSTSPMTTPSLIQPNIVASTTGQTTLRPISTAIPAAQTQPQQMTLANVAPPTRTVTQPFLSPLAMQPSALTQVLFTQPPVAAYSLAQTRLANPLLPSALPQTVIRPPAVTMTTMGQSVITQIITTQPMTTGKAMTTQAITTPALASMVPGVSPYHSLAALGLPYPMPYPVALNKVTTTPAYTTLPLGSAALQKLTMSSLPFHNPTIPITAGTTQATILSPMAGLGVAPPAVGKVPSVPITTPTPVAVTLPIRVTTPVAMTTHVMNAQAIRPRVAVDTATLRPVSAVTTTAAVRPIGQPVINSGVKLVPNSGVKVASPSGVKVAAPSGVKVAAPSGVKVAMPSGVRISVANKDKPQQGVTTSQMEQIIAASSKNVVTNTKSQLPHGSKPAPSNSSKQVAVNQ